MTTTVKATHASGVLTPSEPLDIEEGTEVTLSIEDAGSPKRGLAGIVEAVQELHRTIPPDAWDVLPTDGAKNDNHYLYGSPKEEDSCEWPTRTRATGSRCGIPGIRCTSGCWPSLERGGGCRRDHTDCPVE